MPRHIAGGSTLGLSTGRRHKRNKYCDISKITQPVLETLESRTLLSATSSDSLSSLTPASATIGWGTIHDNASVEGNPLKLHGVTYANGVGTHAASTIVYNLNGQYSTFSSDVGVDDEVLPQKGQVIFEVLGDGVELYNSGMLTNSSPTAHVNVGVEGVKALTLLAVNGFSATIHCDHADWAGAMLTSTSAGSTSPSVVTRPPSLSQPPASTTVPGINTPLLQPPSTINWSSPIVITSGGTYSGNWRSLSANTPAVDIQTSQPVTILNSDMESMSTLISASNGGANVTVKNSSGWALNPNRGGQSPGRFLDAENFSNLDIENNSMVGTAGIEMGYWTGGGTVKIVSNNALNIDGRWSNGNGGFDTGPDQNDYVQFAQFNRCIGMSGVEIAWNCVVNQPGQSRVEDNVSVFQTSGTSSSPILIHDNYIDGGYPADPANDSSYTGGGIMLSDGNTNSASTDTGYVNAYNNIVLDTSNYGLAISSGHNDTIYNNIVVSSGLLPSGQKVASQNVGIYIWNQSSDPYFANAQEYGNTLGWMGPSGRNDSWTPNGSGKTGDATLPGTIMPAQVQGYYAVWAQRVGAAGYVIGAK